MQLINNTLKLRFMKRLLLLFLLCPTTLLMAQHLDPIQEAMANYDYEAALSLIAAKKPTTPLLLQKGGGSAAGRPGQAFGGQRRTINRTGLARAFERRCHNGSTQGKSIQGKTRQAAQFPLEAGGPHAGSVPQVRRYAFAP